MKLQKGFSIVEILLTVAILAVVMAYALPNLQQMMNENRVRGITDTMQMSMGLARSNALKTFIPTYICPKRSDADLCDTNVATQDYTNGWVLFQDCNNNGSMNSNNTCDKDWDGTPESNELIRIFDQNLPDSLEISMDAIYQSQLGFIASGRPENGAATIVVDSPDVSERTITISRTGIISRQY